MNRMLIEGTGFMIMEAGKEEKNYKNEDKMDREKNNKKGTVWKLARGIK